MESFAKQVARSQYNQYGIYDIPDEQLESFARMILEKPEEAERMHKKLFEDKVVSVVKEKATIAEKTVSEAEVSNLVNPSE